MKVIAKKKHGAGVMYILLTLLGVVLLSLVKWSQNFRLLAKKSYQNDTAFFIHCKSNGIDAPKLAIPSLRSLHHATRLRVYHHRRCISSAVPL